MNQSSNTNRTSMKHILLSETTIGSKDLTMGSVQLGNNIFTHANQEIDSIDRRVHGDWDPPFGSRKSGNKMSVDFGRNTDDEIGINPSRTIGIPGPQINKTKLSNYDIFYLVRRRSYLSHRGSSWNSKTKIESGNLRGNKIF